MRAFRRLFITLVAVFAGMVAAEAQQPSRSYNIGDDSNNEISDTLNFDVNAPVMTEGDGTLYYIRKINLHGVKYLNHDILKQSAGLIEGDSIYLPSSFISNAMHRLWAPRYFSDIQIGATIEGDSVDLEVFLKELLTELGYTIVEKEGFEADDILGTIARRCEESGIHALLVTGDRDSMQQIRGKMEDVVAKIPLLLKGKLTFENAL